MYPILFQIGSISLYSYGVSLAVAVLLCSWLLGKDAIRLGLPKETAVDLVFWVTLGGIIGARIFYVMIAWDHFADDLGEIVMINRGGLAWQGGFVGGFTAGWIYVARHQLSFRAMLDLCAPYIALGQAIGRIGCFFNGCCYGKPWVHGIYFPIHHDRLHPTQLYETIMLFGIFLFLKFWKKRSWPKGMVFVSYLWLAGVERFAVEFFRADHETLYLGLSLFQLIALGLIVAGSIFFLRLKR